MPNSARKQQQQNRVSMDGIHNDGNSSVTSQASRHSARLKRKRELQEQQQAIQEAAAQEEEEEEDDDDDEPKIRKRRRTVSAKKTPRPSIQEQQMQEEHDEDIDTDDIEMSDDDEDDGEIHEDMKLPASSSSNHAAASSSYSRHPVESVVINHSSIPGNGSTTAAASRRPSAPKMKENDLRLPSKHTPYEKQKQNKHDNASPLPQVVRKLQLEPQPTPFKKGTGNITDEQHQEPQREENNNINIENEALHQQQQHPVVAHFGIRFLDRYYDSFFSVTGNREEDDDNNDDDELQEENDNKTYYYIRPNWEKPYIHFVLILLLQILYYIIIGGNPLYRCSVLLSNTMYYNTFGSTINNTNIETTADNNNDNTTLLLLIEQEQEKHAKIIREKISNIKKLQKELNILTIEQVRKVRIILNKTIEIQNDIKVQQNDNNITITNLKSIITKLNNTLQQDDDDNNNNKTTTNTTTTSVSPEAITDVATWLRTVDNTTAAIIDLSNIELWQISQEKATNCTITTDYIDNEDDVKVFVDDANNNETSTTDNTNTTTLTMEDLKQALIEIEDELKDAVQSIQNDTDTVNAVRQWIRDGIIEQIGPILVEEEKETLKEKDDEETASIISSIERQRNRINKIIRKRLAIESADQTGTRIDYASVVNGGMIISSTPSLIDGLTISHKILSKLQLRFYGHGPTAAITPTQPYHSLGQCWSYTTRTATITIQLGKPIYVDTVSIEHPLFTNQLKTAIKKFRVFGYEKSLNNNHPYPLGKFEYNIMDTELDIRQEFDVIDEINGKDIPPLHIIQFQFDSNWGGDYTCIYRIRVFGEEDDDEEE